MSVAVSGMGTYCRRLKKKLKNFTMLIHVLALNSFSQKHVLKNTVIALNILYIKIFIISPWFVIFFKLSLKVQEHFYIEFSIRGGAF